MENYKLDDRVKVIGKNVTGKIVFIGETHFSEGEWFGLILDEAKGRNNGSIDGQHYFKCLRNYGLFVRSCQLQKENGESASSFSAKNTVYPNYLVNSTSMKNKSEKKIKTNNKLKANGQSLTSQNRSTSRVIEDLKQDLKHKSVEILNLENENKETVCKLKGMKTERQKLYDELKKSSKRENDLKLEMRTTKNELALLKRKLYKAETCLQSSEHKRSKLDLSMERLSDLTEHAIIEKEIAEEKCEQVEVLLNDEADKFKALQIELDIMREGMKLQIVNGAPAVHYVKKIENENEILKCALFRLKDLYAELSQKLLNSKKVTEKYFKEIEGLKCAEKAMEDTFSKYHKETSELYEIIDSMSNADDMVFEIIERNLKSEEEINQLHQRLYHTENQLEVSEELEDTLQEIRILCGDEIEHLESKVRQMQDAVDQKTILIGEREEIIDKYRKLTFTLQERNRKLTEDLEVLSKDRKEAVLTAENLKLKIQREKRSTTKDLIERENMKYDLESNRDKLNYWMPFMPNNFFGQYGENTAIQVKLIASKILKKINLLTKLLNSSCYDVAKSDELKSVALNTIFLTSLYELYGWISLFIKSSDRIHPEQLLTLGTYHETLEKESREIDSYLTLLADGNFDRKCCVNNIKNTCCSLYRLLNTNYATDGEKAMVYLTCYLNMIQSSCKCLLTYCKALNDNDNSSPEFKSDVNLMTEKTTTIKANVKSILNITKNYENERMCSIPAIEERAKNNWKTIQEITSNTINKYETLIQEDREASASEDTENMLFNEIICKCITVDTDLHELYENLSNGEYFVEYAPDSVFSPVYIWAQSKRREREQFINKLKSQVSASKSDIVSLTESLQIANNKINIIQNLAKKDASQQTDEQKYCIGGCSEKTNASQQTDEQNYCIGECTAKTNYLLLTLQDMENAMKYLRQKNFEISIAPIIDHHKMLKPLKVLPKPKYHQDTHNIRTLQKRLNKLAVKLRGILQPDVVDITTKCSQEIKYKKCLAKKILIKREVENELWNITIDVKTLKTSPHYAWSNTNSFIFQNESFISN